MRVRMEGTPSPLLLAGDSMRAWNPAGSLLAEENGSVRLSAAGDRIAWGGTKMLDSPIDVWSPGGLSLAGKRLPGRIRISARNGGIRVVAVVPLEVYVAAVLSREAPSSFHPEALSALAVAVRTYTLLAIATPRDPDYDVVAGVEDQVFEGVENVGAGFRAAAEATRGEVLHYRGGLARTVYHSTCGGRTESAEAVWGNDVPYLRSVPCGDCRDSPAWRWEYRMSRAEGVRVALALGVRAGNDLGIEIAGRTPTGRASQVRLLSGGVARETKAAVFRRGGGKSESGMGQPGASLSGRSRAGGESLDVPACGGIRPREEPVDGDRSGRRRVAVDGERIRPRGRNVPVGGQRHGEEGVGVQGNPRTLLPADRPCFPSRRTRPVCRRCGRNTLKTDLLAYPLPESLIAQSPAPRRRDARLMAVCRETGKITHHRFSDLPGFLRSGDLLVVNDTKVIRGRLGASQDTGTV